MNFFTRITWKIDQNAYSYKLWNIRKSIFEFLEIVFDKKGVHSEEFFFIYWKADCYLQA